MQSMLSLFFRIGGPQGHDDVVASIKFEDKGTLVIGDSSDTDGLRTSERPYMTEHNTHADRPLGGLSRHGARPQAMPQECLETMRQAGHQARNQRTAMIAAVRLSLSSPVLRDGLDGIVTSTCAKRFLQPWRRAFACKPPLAVQQPDVGNNAMQMPHLWVVRR